MSTRFDLGGGMPCKLGSLTMIAALVLLASAQAHAQEPSAQVLAGHTARVQAALTAGRCGREAGELNDALTALRAESRAVVRRALAAYLSAASAELDRCMGAPSDGLLAGAVVPASPEEIRSRAETSAAPALRARFRAPLDADDESGSGDFDVHVAVRMIRARADAIRSCYERELVRDRTLRGSMRVTFTIRLNGSVANVRVSENTLGSEAVATCVARIVSGFAFQPGPSGGSVTFGFPFVFEPES